MPQVRLTILEKRRRNPHFSTRRLIDRSIDRSANNFFVRDSLINLMSFSPPVEPISEAINFRPVPLWEILLLAAREIDEIRSISFHVNQVPQIWYVPTRELIIIPVAVYTLDNLYYLLYTIVAGRCENLILKERSGTIYNNYESLYNR